MEIEIKFESGCCASGAKFPESSRTATLFNLQYPHQESFVDDLAMLVAESLGAIIDVDAQQILSHESTKPWETERARTEWNTLCSLSRKSPGEVSGFLTTEQLRKTLAMKSQARDIVPYISKAKCISVEISPEIMGDIAYLTVEVEHEGFETRGIAAIPLGLVRPDWRNI